MRRAVLTLFSVGVVLVARTGAAAEPIRIELPPNAPPGAYECRPVEPSPAGETPAPVPLHVTPAALICPPAPAPSTVPPEQPAPPPAEGPSGRAEILVRGSYALVEPQSPVRFAPAPGSTFAAEPGGLYDGSVAPYRGGVQIAAGTGYRATQSFSFGLAGSFTKLVSASVFQDGTKDLARLAFGVAPYVRAYLPISSRLELWGALGIGFRRDSQSFDRPTRSGGGTAPGKWTMTHEGVATTLGFGLDVKLGDSLYIGPSAQYLGVVATGGCLEIDASNLKRKWCTSDKVSVTRAFSYQQMSVGLSARLAL